MAIKLKEVASREEKFAPGHRLCAGCAESIIMRQILNAIEVPVVAACATGCLEVASSMFPTTTWKIPWVHNAFENASTTASGMEAMYRALLRKGKIDDRGIKFMAFGGDGATYDIGLQWISGVIERGHQVAYVCLNNEAYMNTGIQRSSATMLGAHTTTSPAGTKIPGKQQPRKPLTEIIAAHNIPYVAQANPWRWRDLMTKAQKSVAVDGPAFINVLSPCPRGWRHDSAQTIEVAKIATQTCIWPLFEVEDGEWKLNYKPKEKLPVTVWLKMQGRFRHLFTPAFEHIIDEIQEQVDAEWQRLLQRCGEA
ncbi:MAG: pyruvate ferredoxin oxidoreductase [Chloroflexia bacterium]|nr:pyruvate ferredoxin oxidoreductase [Chloroflexia bacterium]